MNGYEVFAVLFWIGVLGGLGFLFYVFFRILTAGWWDK